MTICSKEHFDCFVILGQISYGTIIGFPSPPGDKIESDNHLEKSLLNTISSLCAAIGAIITAGILKGFHNSRKKTLFTISCISVGFWLLNCFIKYSIAWSVLVGALMGIALGCLSTINPLYIVEIAPEGKQSIYGTLGQLGVPIGMIIFNFLGPTLTYMELYYIGASIDLLLAILTLFIDESPAVIQIEIEEEKSILENIPMESLCQKKYIISLFFGTLLMFFQQFCGITAIITNLVDLMTHTGLNINHYYQAGITSSSQIISICFAAMIVEKIGLKITWIVSCIIIVISLLIFALNSQFYWSNILPLITIFFFQLGFGLGIGPIPWFIIPEYFNAYLRSKASAITVALNWLFAFVTVEIWPLLIKSVKMMGLFLFFSGISVAALPFGVLCIKKCEFDDSDETSKWDGMESTYWSS